MSTNLSLVMHKYNGFVLWMTSCASLNIPSQLHYVVSLECRWNVANYRYKC